MHPIFNRYSSVIAEAWKDFPEEIAPLEAYISWCEKPDLINQYLEQHQDNHALIVAGARMGASGMIDIAALCQKLAEANMKISVLFSESTETAQNHPSGHDGQILANTLRSLLHPTAIKNIDIIADVTAKNTGDQAVIVSTYLQAHPNEGDGVIVAASIEHVARMLGCIGDGLRTHDLLQHRTLLPLASGAWDEPGMSGLPRHAEAFLPEPNPATTEEEIKLKKFAGQYTTRYVAAMNARIAQDPRYIGRTILYPSEILAHAERRGVI